MYIIAEVEDVVRIPPNLFGFPLKEAALKVLRERYEGYLHPDLGIIITVFDVKVEELGRILPGDGATYHNARFKVLSFKPQVKEVVEGIVVGATDKGLFVNLGPVDGFLHKSQISDKRVFFDEKGGRYIVEETRQVVEKGDRVRARVVGVSFPTEPTARPRIILTMRQPLLGKLEWVEEELERLSKVSGGGI
ncbi:MAG TPA: DNA-directed RNA polymerase [Pyrodictiaceae archaeon]|nr:DNA-directed RNA polymerase [Pyrodictiaceae archaeon]HIP85439.1 DNA-directed RNA polymerase [Pyrodictium sp.]